MLGENWKSFAPTGYELYPIKGDITSKEALPVLERTVGVVTVNPPIMTGLMKNYENIDLPMYFIAYGIHCLKVEGFIFVWLPQGGKDLIYNHAIVQLMNCLDLEMTYVSPDIRVKANVLRQEEYERTGGSGEIVMFLTVWRKKKIIHLYDLFAHVATVASKWQKEIAKGIRGVKRVCSNLSNSISPQYNTIATFADRITYFYAAMMATEYSGITRIDTARKFASIAEAPVFYIKQGESKAPPVNYKSSQEISRDRICSLWRSYSENVKNDDDFHNAAV